jgi:hypothetical protein
MVIFVVVIAAGLLAGILTRTKIDRRSMLDHGVAIGPPWSGRCVAARQVDLQTSPDASLQLASSAIVAIKGSGIVVDQSGWWANGWTGTHIGAYGSQVAVFVTQVDPMTVRLSCYCRPRCKTTGFTLGRTERRVDRLVGEIQRLSGSTSARVP